MNEKYKNKFKRWQKDWNLFIAEVLKAKLDNEQKAIVTSVQNNRMTAVSSGTARGKDYVAACCAICFLYLTPKFNKKGELIANTKVVLTAPTGRQITNIMTPEVRRQFRSAKFLPGRLVADDIRTDYEEWFLTGFKADDNNIEAWSGMHAVNTMFIVTEASGISEKIFTAIEGNMQGNSRMLIVFNPNITTGYAAKAMKSDRFKKFRLNSLTAENVVKKQTIFPGQVDYIWVQDKVKEWCHKISEADYNEGDGDFKWEGACYRPNDLFRVKVLGMFPKVAADILIPYEWIELANNRWLEYQEKGWLNVKTDKLGVDVAGMGRDSSMLCHRKDNIVPRFEAHQSAGEADHMHVVGMVVPTLKNSEAKAFIDTIGEGAGVYSRLREEGFINAISAKNSEGANGLKDFNNVYEFANMRAYLYWAVRDWLDPKNGFEPCLPPNDFLCEEATEIHWKFRSDGKIQIEPKEDIQERIKRSPDTFDSLSLTFYPSYGNNISTKQILNDFR